MNNSVNFPLSNDSSLWIQNLTNGISGLSIKVKHTVFCGASPFQKVEVFDTYSFGLVLCLGGTVVMTETDSDTYHEMIVHPAMLMHPDPKRVLIIGGGDGGVLREVLKYENVESAVVVEIDNLVHETVRKHFPKLSKGFDDSRTEIVFDDGCQYLQDSKKTFDIIFVDSYDPGGPVQSLETADFHVLVRNCLNSNGIAVFQTDSPITRPEFTRQIASLITPGFSDVRPYICQMRAFPEGICSFLIGSKEKGILGRFDKKRYDEIKDTCTYFNDEIHVGAFLLPQYLKQVFEI